MNFLWKFNTNTKACLVSKFSQSAAMNPHDLPPEAAAALASPLRTGNPWPDEAAYAQSLLAQLQPHRSTVESSAARAQAWIEAIRSQSPPPFAVERLLAQFPISSAEGLALLRLAEALLRVPDTDTAAALAADVLGPARFEVADADEDLLQRATRQSLSLGRRLLPATEGALAEGLLARLGAQTFVRAARAAVAVLSGQFVFAPDVAQAVRHAKQLAQTDALSSVSFDMLGEGARHWAQADRYLQAYRDVIAATATLQRPAQAPHQGANVSIKLSALHPALHEHAWARSGPQLLQRLLPLVRDALALGVPITIDAEESERHELTLDVMAALMQGLPELRQRPYHMGLAVQAYGLRAHTTLMHLLDVAQRQGVRLGVRLVKGAYWDAEIKRAQEQGAPGYPVFTHKTHTDLSYLACAQTLLAAGDAVYPMFATHNAATLAAVRALAAQRPAGSFEFQRLHGMGQALYDVARADLAHTVVRLYAPVGEPHDLLAYLVRRLLENGANSSFVHQLADPAVPPSVLTTPPWHIQPQTALPLPRALLGSSRRNSTGPDVQMRQCATEFVAASAVNWPQAGDWAGNASGAALSVRNPSTGEVLAQVPTTPTSALPDCMARALAAQTTWEAAPVSHRADCLKRAAEALQADLPQWVARLAQEAGKTRADAVAEVREAVDFLRYYAAEAERISAPQTLPGPTGESNLLRWRGRGVWVCVSPWNFPLAIFVGQVAAALVMGNAVLAKPAPQTPRLGRLACEVLQAAGVPVDALQCVQGGADVGAALVALPGVAGVAFTGSTAAAQRIAQSLAAKPGPLTPLIAETGGINAMIVDSTALPEQVIDAVMSSAFASAGQRCSALRLLCVQDDIADGLLAGLAGAVQTLQVGDAADMATDVGPLIDTDAHARLNAARSHWQQHGRLLAESALPAAVQVSGGTFFAPCAFAIEHIGQVQAEHFGPLLLVLRYKASELDALLDGINALGYGLTVGVHSRMASRAALIANKLRVGNVYVNRGMTGAVVGVQPFGGQGLSGTGPKAGGPHYLPRFAVEQTISTNTAAAGGNASLLAGG